MLPAPHALHSRIVVDRPLPQAFYARECLEVALDLLGKVLVHGDVALRITELEAYRHGVDTANHCRFGVTARNAPMWGPPGHAYVYLCYGLHQMLNLVTDAEGRGAAVLVRSCEIVEGHALVRARRGGKDGPVLLTGPGKVASALGIDTRFSGEPLFARGPLCVLDAPAAKGILVGPRVGVDYADPEHVSAPWRVALAGTPWVSHPKRLSPLEISRAAYLRRERMREPNASRSDKPRVAQRR